ncbi:MAG: class II aldolase/adducin family protein [candidate division KSB1 bacterium]|nr:class II aldolase/adducin family protein [candidate division KSB1 bacterium]MDZ7346785.1 class II aldolase/adducin family protein [candidate division KSB1 bacterium]MDZ7371033.1 class II aldolase/adducin family protein [candidate division KSB1 bacterium]
MAKSLYQLRREIVEVGRRTYQRGYVASNDGNISARVDENRVLITPTGVSKGFMKEDDLVLVDMEGKVLTPGKRASSEVFMHLRIYKERPDVNSVCHAHPIYATAHAVAGLSLEKCVLPEVIIALGGIPLVEYGEPGTEKFFEPVLKYLKDHDAFLLQNHGALTIGSSVINAYHKMETLEHFAHISFVAHQLGHVNVLPKEEVKSLLEARKRYGVSVTAGCLTCDTPGNTSCEIYQGASALKEEKAALKPTSGGEIDREALVRLVTEAVLKKLSQ